MIIVKVKNSNSLEQALKIYKNKVHKSKQNEQLRERQEFKKPSFKKRAQTKREKYIQKYNIVE
jgi:small subunit ribosomal protein S21